jgi:hypothetical protein
MSDGLTLWDALEPPAAAEAARVEPLPVDPAPLRHTPERSPDPGERCDWPEHPEDDEDPTICGRIAVVIYSGRPTPSARYTADYPRCKRHDTVAAQRRAAADGWTRRELSGGSEA